jgi:4-hydroxy-tetrahydrodipicolinate reductase
MSIRVTITGADGRMGRALLEAVHGSPDHLLAGATERADHPLVGLPFHDLVLRGALEEALDVDVVVDFTAPEASMAHARACAARGVPLVVGTTGFSRVQQAELGQLATRIPVVSAPNMSVGVNLLFGLAARAAKVLGEAFDVEIVEAHHRHKKDAPSGTALRLGESVAAALGRDLSQELVTGRSGMTGERGRSDIAIHAIRGGDVVGDHTVLFLGDGERVELTHKASTRGNFARGALRAAFWVVGRPPGLYDMADVLGLAS